MNALLLAILATGAAPPLPATVSSMKPDAIRQLLAKPGPHAECEVALAILGRQTRQGNPPAAPKFPFTPQQARRYQQDYARWAGLPVEVTNGDGLTLVLIPPGCFVMGSPTTEKGRNKDEQQVDVTLTKPLYLGKHEVTVAQFRRFVETTKHITDGERNNGGNAHDEVAVWKHRDGTSWRKPGFAGPYKMADNHAVVHVSHDDTTAFSRWLTDRGASRLRYTLPTEAQWEWACRSGSGGRFWWGDDIDDASSKRLNIGDVALKRLHPRWPRTTLATDDGHAFVAPVGSYEANSFGLHDMLGNVWEFCSTKAGPYPTKPVTDPGDFDPKRGFAVRGGGWSNEVQDCRCATRNADPPRFCHSNLGFRIALH